MGSDLDLYYATRTSLDAPFSAPIRIDELSTTGVDEQNPWVSVGDNVMYFTTRVVNGNDILVRTQR
jgi:hypothetical protein